MNRYLTANAPDCSLILKRDKIHKQSAASIWKSRSLTWVYLSFSISTSEKARKLLNVLYTNLFFFF